MRVEELAKTIDSTMLEATSTTGAVESLCRDAISYHFASVCVLPYCVPVARQLLQGYDVKVGTVVSYPLGADSQRTKIVGAEQAVALGADEIDVIMNVPAMLSGDFRYVRDELRSVVRAVRMTSVNTGRGLVLFKANVEAYYLDDKLKRLACKIVEDSVPTSSRLQRERRRAARRPRTLSCSVTFSPRVWEWTHPEDPYCRGRRAHDQRRCGPHRYGPRGRHHQGVLFRERLTVRGGLCGLPLLDH